MKRSSYLKGKWPPEMENYYRADAVEKIGDRSYTTNSSPEHITKALQGAIGGHVDRLEYAGRITQPAILIHALENYSEEPILPEVLARETVDTMKACEYITVPGNHITMLYGKGAREIARVIDDFSKQDQPTAAALVTRLESPRAASGQGIRLPGVVEILEGYKHV